MRTTVVAALTALLLAGCESRPPKQAAPPPSTAIYELLKASELATSAKDIESVWREPKVALTEANTFRGVDEVEIAYRIYRQPRPSPAVVISSGRTEHFGKYREVVYDFWRNGYSVYIHDHRGQGVSGRLLGDDAVKRQKGHVVRFDDYVKDLDRFVKEQVIPGKHTAHFLLGHSMGGAIATLYLIERPGVFHRAVLTSPMHKPNTAPLSFLACPVTTSTVGIGRDSWVFFGILDTVYKKPTADNIFTSSPERLERWFVDGIPERERIGAPTRNWLAEACYASDLIFDKAATIRTPLMVLQAENDEAVVPHAQDDFCSILEKAGNPCHPHGRPVPYPTTVGESAKTGHELLIERDSIRTDAMTRIMDFFRVEVPSK